MFYCYSIMMDRETQASMCSLLTGMNTKTQIMGVHTCLCVTFWLTNKMSCTVIWFNGWLLYHWPGSGGSCFSSLAIADSFGLGRGSSSPSFAGVEDGFEIRSSSRLLWLQTKIDALVRFIFRKGIHEIINSVLWRCRAWRQLESFKFTTSWLHATIPRPYTTQYKA